MKDLHEVAPEGYVPCSPELLESGVDCATAPCWSNPIWDGHSHWHPKPRAQLDHVNDEPIVEVYIL